MAIAFDVATNSGSKTASPLSWSHTTGAGSNLLLVIGVGLRMTEGTVVSGITISPNDGTVTNIAGATADEGTFHRTELWYVVGIQPNTTYTIEVTLSGAFTEAVCTSISLTGCAQSGQPDASAATFSSGAATLSQAIVTVANNAWVTDILTVRAGSSNFAPSGTSPTQTERTGFDGTDTDSHASTAGPVTPAASYTDGWTWTQSGRCALSIASFAPAGGGGGGGAGGITPLRSLLGVGI